MLRPFRSPRRASHEDVFVERYARLLARAKQITGGDRLAAEDLVHDAFVNFTLSQPDLSAIQSLDGYLFTTLRHLHLSKIRRGKHLAGMERTLRYEKVDVHASWAAGNMLLSAFVTNVANTRGVIGFGEVTYLTNAETYIQPRTFGVRVRTRF